MELHLCKSLYTKTHQTPSQAYPDYTHRKQSRENTRQTSVTIETEHAGHIEDLLIKPPWKYYSLHTLKAETQTVTTLQEQETHHSTTSNNREEK